MIGVGGSVLVQHALDDQEHVAEPSFLEGGIVSIVALSQAQAPTVVLNVRMGCFVLVFGPIRGDCGHVEPAVGQMHLDTEFSEIYSLNHRVFFGNDN